MRLSARLPGPSYGMKIQCAELNQLLQADHSDSKPLVIDVRTPAEFSEMSIAGSKSMPLDQLDAGTLQSLSGNHSECVVVCYSGKRSDQACRKLSEAGIEGVRSLQGGLEAWERQKLPLERSAKAGFSFARFTCWQAP